MMANNYESLKTDGHYTLARRIFTKIKSWAEPKSVVCTQAEYDALPSSKNTDGKTYYAYDAVVSTSTLINLFYPVGSYYETDDTSFNPNLVWTGTWVKESEGLVHVSSGTNYVVSSNSQDGGSATVTLDVTQIPAHKHRIREEYGANANVSYPPNNTYSQIAGNNAGTKSWQGDPIENTGGGQPHNNMQPYKIVNRWHRTT